MDRIAPSCRRLGNPRNKISRPEKARRNSIQSSPSRHVVLRWGIKGRGERSIGMPGKISKHLEKKDGILIRNSKSSGQVQV